MNRRDFTHAAAASAALVALGGRQAPGEATGATPPGPMPAEATGQRPLTIAMLVHPDMVLLDLVGPQTIFALLMAKVHLVWKEPKAVMGRGGSSAGYRATSHWYVRDLLPMMGATTAVDRVVVDRNRVTGAGVTAGIDYGLTLAAVKTMPDASSSSSSMTPSHPLVRGRRKRPARRRPTRCGGGARRCWPRRSKRRSAPKAVWPLDRPVSEPGNSRGLVWGWK